MATSTSIAKPSVKLKKRSLRAAKTRRLNIPSLVYVVTGADANNSQILQARIKQGIDVTAIEKLSAGLSSTQRELTELLSIPVSTLRRRRDEGHLNPNESGRVVRFARLWDLARELMSGDEKAAVQWLREPQALLADETPLEHAKTELGAREVEDLIGRLNHGVFS